MTRWAEMAHEELLAVVADVQAARKAIDARMLAVTGEVESRGLAAEHGFRDTADLLQSTQRVPAAVAKARVRAVRAVVPERSLLGEELPAQLPSTALGLSAAEISFEHVRVIQQTLDVRPCISRPITGSRWSGTSPSWRAARFRGVAPGGEARVGAAGPGRAAPVGRCANADAVRFTPRGEGFKARGWFDRESAAIVRTALSPLSEPVPEHGPGECEQTGCEHLPGERRPGTTA
ncbi:DUF222 domain-containing protein [Pseudonocardia lutea]|uniref:DUF222 domain-containing protein n=1 Tax=Pseudonocardia lutea TaxID=2172015 RepID=A0ABW1I5G6_9PSEU